MLGEWASKRCRARGFTIVLGEQVFKVCIDLQGIQGGPGCRGGGVCLGAPAGVASYVLDKVLGFACSLSVLW